ncbi:thiamine diphosphokinase [Peptoniphilus equinus]|uniref:Thiamine diphosphokinase n=1 Tax=Peptoniphilus equinus TaxID=3016343 RepID=A0ABY7QR37_9FIRM|nr:thiamine diphosphokinase [Peptoniphilus equinus]WBW49247.1 thiamine diphosphokinase [Peptoniphilus equinus]
MKGLVVSGGRAVKKDLLRRYCEDAYVICCDGGIKNFYGTDLVPDLIVGDFDSIDDMGKAFVAAHRIPSRTYKPEKNFTDTEAALALAFENCDNIVLLAATGTRMDHTLGNLFSMSQYGPGKVTLVDDHNTIRYVEPGRYTFSKSAYQYISVVALTQSLTYSTDGMKYETDHLSIKSCEMRGVSNEICMEEGVITVHSGAGFIIQSND